MRKRERERERDCGGGCKCDGNAQLGERLLKSNIKNNGERILMEADAPLDSTSASIPPPQHPWQNTQACDRCL